VSVEVVTHLQYKVALIVLVEMETGMQVITQIQVEELTLEMVQVVQEMVAQVEFM
jgi:hypothetical protein